MRAEIKKNDIKKRNEPLTATWVSPSECFWHLWAHPHHPSRVPPPGAAVRFWWMLAWTHSWPHQNQPASESSLAEVCPLTAQGSCLTNKNESRHSVTMVKLTYQELIFTKSGIWVYTHCFEWTQNPYCYEDDGTLITKNYGCMYGLVKSYPTPHILIFYVNQICQ